MRKYLLICATAIVLAGGFLRAQVPAASPSLPADDRYKADILLVVAHPDDETAIGGILAKSVFDDHSRVAIAYCNRGGGGGNSVGNEQLWSLALEREIEARKAAASFGITNVWFMDGRDTPGQDVFQSLDNWHHGTVLEETVRIIRLTRAEVLITWLPHVDAGENHGDHQASGVIATEAFDMAGDPTVFPAQVIPPREHNDINSSTEGLSAWQPKKIYYFSDASHVVVGPGPRFDLSEVSPARHVPYYRLAAELHLPHRTQADVAEEAEKAIASGDFAQFRKYLETFHLLFGKAVVPCSPAGALLDGITAAQHAFVAPPGFHPGKRTGVSLELGGAFSYYQDFWKTHGIENVGPLIGPEITVAAGSYFYLPLILRNDTSDSLQVTLSSELPEGWKELSGTSRYTLSAGEIRAVQTFLRAPAELRKDIQHVIWSARIKGGAVRSASIDVTLADWTLPE